MLFLSAPRPANAIAKVRIRRNGRSLRSGAESCGRNIGSPPIDILRTLSDMIRDTLVQAIRDLVEGSDSANSKAREEIMPGLRPATTSISRRTALGRNRLHRPIQQNQRSSMTRSPGRQSAEPATVQAGRARMIRVPAPAAPHRTSWPRYSWCDRKAIWPRTATSRSTATAVPLPISWVGLGIPIAPRISGVVWAQYRPDREAVGRRWTLIQPAAP